MNEEKPPSWNSYPKVYALGHAAIKQLSMQGAVIEEKVDGSQFSFCRTEDGRLLARSRKVQLHELVQESGFLPEGHQFAKAWESALAVYDRLSPGYTYRCEYLAKPKHNTLSYERVPANHLVVFDIAVGLEDYLPAHDVHNEALRLGLEPVPTLGTFESIEQLDELLKRQSALGGQIEGFVLKKRGELFGRDGKPAHAKYVSTAFKEAHTKDWTKRHPKPTDFVEKIVDGLHLEARWHKAVHRLRDEGRLQEGPQDIGPLIKDVSQDIEAELEEDIKEALYQNFRTTILRKATAPIPNWYKAQLAKNQTL